VVEARRLVDDVWPWRDWYSRLIAKRILSHFISKAYVPISESTTASRGGGVLGQEVDLVKELKELKATVSELANAVAEVKAILADLTGPYSLYKPREEAKPQATVQTQVQQAPSMPETTVTAPRVVEETRREGAQVAEKPEVKPAPQATRPPPSGFEELAGILGEAGRVVREERAALAGASVKRTLTLMSIIYELMKHYPRSSVERVLDLIEQLKIVSSEEAKLMKATLDVVDQSIRENITPEENTLLMYILLKNIGVREEALEEEVLRTVLKALTTLRREGRHTLEVAKKGETEGGKDNSMGGEGGGNKWESLQQ
jgi:hypothetical protein